jgi:X-Pro dipeptidyl-peptidase
MSRALVFAGLMVAAPLLAGCLSGDDGGAAAADEENVVESAAGLTNYLSNVSEEIPGVSVSTALVLHERIEAIDGVLLDTWIVRPDVEGPVPVVLQVTPYYSGGNPVLEDGHMLGDLGEILVERGYAYGISSVRGTGLSEGCFTQGGPTEAKDTARVIEHVASQDWSNGNVGLIGVSYPGTTPQDVWVEAPPSLKTIVPISGISDLYKYNFVNGVHIDPQGFAFNAYYWALVGGPPFGYTGSNGVNDPLNIPGAVVGEVCTDQLLVQEGGATSALDGNKDGYWQVRDFHAELLQDWKKPRASVFYIHGLQDWNVKPHMMEEWLPALQATGVPFKAWLGQWTHAWPQREDWWNATVVAWFDEFLKERSTGILDAPAVQVQDDDGVWRHEDAWPPVDVAWHTFYPTVSGALDEMEPGTGSVEYHDGMGGAAVLPPGAVGQAVWVSQPLARDIHVAGLPRFEADVTAEGMRANLILTLAERSSSGDRAINFAAQSLNHVESLSQGDPDVSGLTQRVVVDFFPQDDVVHAGNRLVLIAAGNTAGSPGPALTPVADGGMIRIDLEGASLTVPVDESLVFEDPQPCWEEACYLYP